MEEELKSLIKVGVSAVISVSYCYFLPRIKSGFLRLVFVFPVCALFLFLPLLFTFSILSSITASFLSGLANLKLILFSFDKGPLFPLPPSLSQFIFLACFPIKLQQSPNSHRSQNHSSKWGISLKVVILGMLSQVYNHKQNMPPILLIGLYPLHFYLELDIFFAFIKFLLIITLQCELEPQFNEPYLATSLQDFWGRRWNLMVSEILRSGVYVPVRRVCNRLMNSNWDRFLGLLATFLVSGLFHELLYVYVTREMPTWEITLFFLLHGFCTATEVAVKRTKFGRRWKMRPAVSRLLTVGFLVVTGNWLFFPQFTRSNEMERRTNETSLFFDFLKRKFLIR